MLVRPTMSRPSFFVLPLLGLAVGAITFACGGSIDSGTQRGSDPTSPAGGPSGGSKSGTARPEPCEGEVSCGPSYKQVPWCSAGPNCDVSSFCGVMIYCQVDPSQCDGYPDCDPGHTKVASSSQCIQDDAVCYQRTTCGVTIWCTGPITTDAGSLDASRPPPPPPPPPNP